MPPALRFAQGLDKPRLDQTARTNNLDVRKFSVNLGVDCPFLFKSFSVFRCTELFNVISQFLTCNFSLGCNLSFCNMVRTTCR